MGQESSRIDSHGTSSFDSGGGPLAVTSLGHLKGTLLGNAVKAWLGISHFQF
jgi:hypothetical protein